MRAGSPERSKSMTSPFVDNNNTKGDIRQVLDVLVSLEKRRKKLIKDMDELFFYLREVIQEVENFYKKP